MKKSILAVTPILCVLAFLFFSFFKMESTDILKQLGVTDEDAKGKVWDSFWVRYFAFPMNATIKSIPASAQSVAVREIGAFAKAYTRSDAFKKRYADARESNKPPAPEKPKSMAERKQERRQELLKMIKDGEESKKSVPADQRSVFDEMLAPFREQLKDIDNPSNPMFDKDAEASTKLGYEGALLDYQHNVETWEKKFPLSSDEMVKHWLQEFLTISKDVDFAAKLVPGEKGMMVFANSEYESKSSDWKLCYRAGKENIAAAQVVFRQWLSEMK